MRRVSTALIASLALAVCLGTVLSARNISQHGGGWISSPLASARALASSLSQDFGRLPLGRALMLAIGGQGFALMTPFLWVNDVAQGRLVMPFPEKISRRGWSYWLIYPTERRMVPS